jgi:hypothetical protein
MATKSEKVVAERPQQAKCKGCNHSESFHARGHCMVMGCSCKKWNGPKVLTRREREEREAAKAAKKK